MKNHQRQRDTLFSVTVFLSAFAVNLLIQKLFTTQTLVVSDFAENPWIWLRDRFGNRQRFRGEFCFYLSLLCL